MKVSEEIALLAEEESGCGANDQWDKGYHAGVQACLERALLAERRPDYEPH